MMDRSPVSRALPIYNQGRIVCMKSSYQIIEKGDALTAPKMTLNLSSATGGSSLRFGRTRPQCHWYVEGFITAHNPHLDRIAWLGIGHQIGHQSVHICDVIAIDSDDDVT